MKYLMVNYQTVGYLMVDYQMKKVKSISNAIIWLIDKEFKFKGLKNPKNFIVKQLFKDEESINICNRNIDYFYN